MGTHVLTVLDDPSQVSISPGPDQEAERFSIRTLIQPVLAIACVALTILSAWLLWDRHKVAQRPVAQPASFWTSFLGAGAPVKIILPTPVFFTYPMLPKVHLRDTAINDFESWRNSETVTSLVKNGGDPTLDHSYTVTSDTLAAIDLAHYLDTVGVADRVAFEVTGESSMNLLEKANVVALGAFNIHESLRLQFRLEAFNVLNRVQFGFPNTTVGSSNFGFITSQANLPRNVQAALKLYF
jgi:hypothetical protein